MRGRLALAVALIVAGGAAAVPALLREEAVVEATGQGYVNDDRPDTLNAHNSPAAAADPDRPQSILLADRIDTPLSNCSLAATSDAGSNWTEVVLPLPAEAPNCFWPDVAWSGDGDALVLYGATGGQNNQPVGTWVQRMRDGEAVDPPVLVSGAHAFHPRLAADGDRVVATWVAAGPNTSARALGFAPEANPIVVAISADGGRTFGEPVEVGDRERRAVVPNVVVAGDMVVVSALDLVDDVNDYSGLHEARGGPVENGTWQVVTWTSSDGGASFAEAVTVGDVEIPQRIHVDLGAPRPGLAHDRASDRLYATWESGEGPGREVYVSVSEDAGATWSPARPVVTRPGTQTLPAVAVAPDGRVDVVFYDRSRDPEDVMTEVVQASSWDGGESFTVATVSRRAFDSRIGLGSYQDLPILGTQTEVVPDDDSSVVLWSDTVRATRDDNRQDLGVALVRVAPAEEVNGALVAGAGALVGAGVLLALSARRRQPRSGTDDPG